MSVNQPPIWDHDRECRVAYCRVHGDRHPIEVVARDLGVSEATLRTMLDRGRVLSRSGVDLPHVDRRSVERRDGEEQKRRERFMREMKAARRRREEAQG